MFIKILFWLIHAANTDPWQKDLFYYFKDKVLKKYGKRVSLDQQHIIKKCWSCSEGITDGYYNGYCFVDQPYHPCTKCNGTGKFDEFWVLLEVWTLGKYEFHKPVERVQNCECFNFKNSTPAITMGIRNFIEGYIKHDPHPRAKLAFWVLAFIYIPRWAFKEKINSFKNRLLSPWLKLKNKFRCFKYGNDDIPF